MIVMTFCDISLLLKYVTVQTVIWTRDNNHYSQGLDW
jgi:hypothetical protein